MLNEYIINHSPLDETEYKFPNGKGAIVKYTNFHNQDWWFDVLELDESGAVIETPYREYDEDEIEARLMEIAA